MSGVLGVGFVDVRPDTSKMGKDLARQLSSGSAKSGAESSGRKVGGFFAGAFGKVAAAAGGAILAKKLGGIVIESVGLASDVSEAASKVGVVFGEQAAALGKFAKGADTALGLSERSALDALGTFGNLFRAMDIGTPIAAKMSKGVVNMAADLASFNNADPTEVLDALRAGLVGEAEPLRRFGVNINAARIEAEALQSGLATAPVDMAKVTAATTKLEDAQLKATAATKKFGAGSLEARKAQAGVALANQAVEKSLQGQKVELTAAQKAQATYALILKDTKLAQGDFSRTSGGLANQQRILAAQVENVKTSLGKFLLPIALTIVKLFTTRFVPAMRSAGKFVAELGRVASAAFKAGFSGGSIRNLTGFAGVVGKIGRALSALIDFIKGDVPSAGVSLGTLFGLQEDSPQVEGFIGALTSARDIVQAFVEFIARNWKPILIGAGVALAAIASPVLGVVAGIAVLYVKFGLVRTIVKTVVTSLVDLGVAIAGAVMWLTRNKDIAIALAAPLAALAAAFVTMLIISKVKAAIVAFKAAQVALNLAMAANPVAVVVIGLVALGAAIFIAYKKFKPFRDIVDKVGRVLKTVGLWLAAHWKPILIGVGAALLIVVSPIAAIAAGAFLLYKRFKPLRVVIDAVGRAIGKGFKLAVRIALPVLRSLQDQVEGFLQIVAGVVRLFMALIHGDWSKAWSALGDIARGALKLLIGIVKAPLLALQGVVALGLRQLPKVFGIAWGLIQRGAGLFIKLLVFQFIKMPLLIVSALVTMGIVIWEGIKKGIEILPGLFLGIVDAVVDFFVKLPGRVVSGLGNLGSALWNGARSGFELFKNNIGNVVDGIVDFFKKLPGRITAFLGDVGSAALDIGKSILDNIVDGITGAISAAGDLAGKLSDAFLDAIKGAWNWVIDKANNVWNDIELSLPFGRKFGLPDDTLLALKLGKGAVLDRPTLAMLGETQKARPEIVTPERLMRQIVREEGGGSGVHVEQHNVFEGLPQDAALEIAAQRLGWRIALAGR